MSAARDRILAAIDKRLGPPTADRDTIAAEAAALVADPDTCRPALAGSTTLERFIAKATSERVTASVERMHFLSDVPGKVAAYLTRAGLAPRIALQPRAALTGLDWSGIDHHASPAPDEPAAVSIADMAVAETGSVVFLSGPDAPVLMSFLPLHHIVVVETATIRRHLEDVFAFVGSGQQDQPRNVNIVTGTSGTADIEAKNIRGAHGPRFMHLLLVGPSGAD